MGRRAEAVAELEQAVAAAEASVGPLARVSRKGRERLEQARAAGR